jgi:predicted transcriptional regulator
VSTSNTHFGETRRTVERGSQNIDTQEESRTTSKTQSNLDAIERSIERGLSYAFQHGNFKELSNVLSKALKYAQRNLESYKQTLQATNSVEFRSALLPKVFNQLKEEEAQKLQNSGLSKEEIEAKAAMNALARLDDMIEKSPKELFKYLNKVSELPDAEKLREKVEKNTPKEGEVGNPPPELQQKIQEAESKLNSEYSLNAYVGTKRQAEALAKKLTRLTDRQAEVIKTGKGYMVSVGGFQSEDLARELAQGLGLKNYRVVKVEPQQQQPQPQQQPPAPAKK